MEQYPRRLLTVVTEAVLERDYPTLVALNFVGDSLRARFDPAAARSRW